nr:immunoglobulin heavy chain junction region [Macaca mulatta]
CARLNHRGFYYDSNYYPPTDYW